jgi:hypothetical protein
VAILARQEQKTSTKETVTEDTTWLPTPEATPELGTGLSEATAIEDDSQATYYDCPDVNEGQDVSASDNESPDDAEVEESPDS